MKPSIEMDDDLGDDLGVARFFFFFFSKLPHVLLVVSSKVEFMISESLNVFELAWKLTSCARILKFECRSSCWLILGEPLGRSLSRKHQRCIESIYKVKLNMRILMCQF